MAFQYYMAKAEGDLIISLGQQTAENLSYHEKSTDCLNAELNSKKFL